MPPHLTPPPPKKSADIIPFPGEFRPRPAAPSSDEKLPTYTPRHDPIPIGPLQRIEPVPTHPVVVNPMPLGPGYERDAGGRPIYDGAHAADAFSYAMAPFGNGKSVAGMMSGHVDAAVNAYAAVLRTKQDINLRTPPRWRRGLAIWWECNRRKVEFRLVTMGLALAWGFIGACVDGGPWPQLWALPARMWFGGAVLGGVLVILMQERG